MKTIIPSCFALALFAACAPASDLDPQVPPARPSARRVTHAPRELVDPGTTVQERTELDAPADPILAATAGVRTPHPSTMLRHDDECRASYPARKAQATADLAALPAGKAKLEQRCKVLLPACVLNRDRHVLGCHGVTGDDVNFVESVCAIFPLVVAFDESGECADVDEPELVVHLGDDPKALATAWR